MQEFDSRRGEFVGGLFVAKQSKRSSTHQDLVSAQIWATALLEAGRLAAAFNMEVQKCFQFMCAGNDNYGGDGDGDGWNARVDQRLWRVQFLACFMYTRWFFSSELTLGLPTALEIFVLQVETLQNVLDGG